jgi:hypothetical protein
MSRKLIVAMAIGLVVSTVGLPGAMRAQEAQDADEIARQLSNPVGSLASLVLQGNYAQLDGSVPGVGDQSSTSLIFMPTLPFKLGSGNLIVRPSFPLVGVPMLDEDGAWTKQREFGDIVLLANWGRKEKSGILWSIGGTFVFPTASGDVGDDQWQAGPAAIFGFLKSWGVLGAMWQHWYGLNSDEGEEKISKGTLQLFYWFSLPKGWQVGGSPIPTANYLGATTEFTVPINLGVAKTFILGKTPLKTTLQGQYFLTRPDEVGPSWGIFFQVTPVVQVPW